MILLDLFDLSKQIILFAFAFSSRVVSFYVRGFAWKSQVGYNCHHVIIQWRIENLVKHQPWSFFKIIESSFYRLPIF